ncbi:hypothetical protein [Xanthomonas sp. MUS 060]|uniref:hypothetical protein n=1 Tax=Xanthomonas sp. MUS 060 TaxID=1588031 RepID=UPI000B250A08|nr:hypothetical protein [Xanthomonas sp. MUS 060]
MKLKVIQPFGGYAVGDEITIEEEIKRVSDSEQAHYVVKVPDEPTPNKVLPISKPDSQ